MAKDAKEGTYRIFLERYPEYGTTSSIDDLRAAEFSRIDKQGHVYLDYTGAGLYGDSQVKDHAEFLLNSVIGNPHSFSPSSTLATECVEQCRRRILEFFNASPEEYVPILTANATHALKLVGEGYPFHEGDIFLLSFDNHNSVNGIREFDRARGAITRYIPVVPPDMHMLECALERYLSDFGTSKNRLFAIPAQSNFSGVQPSLGLIERAQAHGWDVLLDAAAFVPTNRLDLGRWHPDYVAISFYKMFGYPTGVGALIARRKALEKLHRPWFAGGTITIASVQADRYFLAPGAQGFEDGTLNYASLPAIEQGLDFISEIGLDKIHTRVKCLTGWLIERMLELSHGNGKNMIRVYGPTDMKDRGGAVSFNMFDSSGYVVDQELIEKRAGEWNISLRTGCFCNPGAGEMALGLTKEELDRCFNQPEARMTYNEFKQCVDSDSPGAVRVSIGLVSNFKDVETFLKFLEEFRDA